MTASVKKQHELKRRVLSPKQQRLKHFALGSSGEDAAARFLIKKGYNILERNLSYKNKEADIIALDTKSNEIVFVEVKTRSTGYYGNPAHAVDRVKLRALKYIATVFLSRSRLENDYRFDIITVLPSGIEHFENVTWGRR